MSEFPFISAGYGLKTPFGILLPPGGRVAAYVRSGGQQSYDDPVLVSNLVSTLAAGLARCRSGLGDTVVVLPGHSESVSTATALANLLPGTRVVGVGRGSAMPTFRWTAAAATWAIDDADCVFSGLRLRLEGFDGVTKAINVTAADCAITGCDIETGSGASNKAAIAIEIGTAAHRFELVGNIIRGTIAGAGTDVVLVAGVANGVRITDNEISCATGAVGTGCIRVGAVAALDLKILRNIIRNSLAASETGIGSGDAASTGIIAQNFISVEAGTPVSDGIELHANSLFRCFDNKVTDTKGTSGLLGPAVVT